MDACTRLRPLLSRFAEGEAAPREALRGARHLSTCTACRIHLARERRLAELLEAGLDDRLPVGEDFVRSVMASLPAMPPPAPRFARRRKLKLACIAGFLAVAPLFAPRAVTLDGLAARLPLPGGPAPGSEEQLLTVLAGALRALPVALDAMAGFVPPLRTAASLPGFAAVSLLPAVVAVGLAAALVMIASRRWAR